MKKAEEKSKNFWELLVESYENDMKRLEEMYSLDSEEESEPVSEEELEPTSIPDSIPIEWMENKREELEKEYYNLFHAYTDESRNNQVQLLNDLHAFNTVLRYWEKENETNRR